MALAAFLMQPNPPALAVWEVILDAHCHYGANASEAVNHHADERAITQADDGRNIDAVEQMADLVFGEHRRLTPPHDMLGPAHRMRRVDGEDLADDEPANSMRIAARCCFTVGLAAVVCSASM
jgi:hypothetical protein